VSQGYLMFAHNNAQVDYGLMALCAATMIRANSRVKDVTLVADEGTISWLREQHGERVDTTFDQIIEVDGPPETTQERTIYDTQYSPYRIPWHNEGRSSAYELSPYDETILLDCDYLLCSDVLDAAWGSDEPYRINRRAKNLLHEDPPAPEQRLETFGIPMYWATCVYFRKCPEAKSLFDLVDVVRENYDYYQFLYRFPGKLYRNDYAFSVALHVLSGWTENVATPLPVEDILTCFDTDSLLEVPAKNELTFLVQDREETWKYRVSRTKALSVHVMNKFSLIRQADRILELHGDK
jgi:hypothetical protein